MTYAQQLRAALSPPDRSVLDHIAAQAQQQAVALYLVGGPVRDCVLTGRIADGDFDLAVEGDAIRLARAAAGGLNGTLHVFERFGTAKISLPDQTRSFDLAMTRTETYARPGALPDVRRGTIATDLVRRDFTINAMALRLDGAHFGELIDLHGGEADLRRRTLRVLHAQSFRDDPTRLFRAARFEQRFNFQLAGETQALIPAALPVLDEVSGDRLRHELELIWREAQPLVALLRLQAWGVLAQIDPALEIDPVVSARFAAHTAPYERFACWAWWLGGHSVADIERVTARLNLRRDEAVDLVSVAELIGQQKSIGEAQLPSVVYHRLQTISARALIAARDLISDAAARANIDRFVAEWRQVTVAIDGRQVQAWGLPPGPAVGRVLRAVQDAVLDGRVASELDQEHLARKLIAQEVAGDVETEA